MVTRMQNVESLLDNYANVLVAHHYRSADPAAVSDARDQLMTYLRAQLGQDRPAIDLQTLMVEPLPLTGSGGNWEAVEFPGTIVAHQSIWDMVVVHAGRIYADVPERMLFTRMREVVQARVVAALNDLKMLEQAQLTVWNLMQMSRGSRAVKSQFIELAKQLGIALTLDQQEKLS